MTADQRQRRPLYRELAAKVQARLNCIQSGNTDWETNHEVWLKEQAKAGPSGGGIDCGTTIDLDKSTGEKLVFDVSFHHMNGMGYYDGWSEHSLIVTASLQFGFNIRITGRDRNDIKDYLHEVYHTWLATEVDIS